MPEKIAAIENQRLPHDFADFLDDVADGAIMAIRFQSALLSGRQLSLRARAPVFFAEELAKFIYVNVDVVAGLIFGERDAIAVENFSANGGDSGRAEGLGL